MNDVDRPTIIGTLKSLCWSISDSGCGEYATILDKGGEQSTPVSGHQMDEA